jgi:polyphosphate kinase
VRIDPRARSARAPGAPGLSDNISASLGRCLEHSRVVVEYRGKPRPYLPAPTDERNFFRRVEVAFPGRTRARAHPR